MSNFNSKKLDTSLKSSATDTSICNVSTDAGSYCSPARVLNYNKLKKAETGIYDGFALTTPKEPLPKDPSNIITLLVEYEACGGDCEAPCYADCGNGCLGMQNPKLNDTINYKHSITGNDTIWFKHKNLKDLAVIQDGSCGVGNLIKLGVAPGYYPYSIDYNKTDASWVVTDQTDLSFEAIGRTGSQPPAYLYINASGAITSGDRINWCNASPNLHFDIFAGSDSGLKTGFNLNNATTYSYKPAACNVVGNFQKPNPQEASHCTSYECEMRQNSFYAPSKKPPGPSPGTNTCTQLHTQNIIKNWPNKWSCAQTLYSKVCMSGNTGLCNVDISFTVKDKTYSQSITPCNGYINGDYKTPAKCQKTITPYDLPTFNFETNSFNNGCCCESWGLKQIGKPPIYDPDWFNIQEYSMKQLLIHSRNGNLEHPYWKNISETPEKYNFALSLPSSEIQMRKSYCPSLYNSPDISMVFNDKTNAPIKFPPKDTCKTIFVKPKNTRAPSCLGGCLTYGPRHPGAPIGKEGATVGLLSSKYQWNTERDLVGCTSLNSDGYDADTCIMSIAEGGWAGSACEPSVNTCSALDDWSMIDKHVAVNICKWRKDNPTHNCILWDENGLVNKFGSKHVDTAKDCSGYTTNTGDGDPGTDSHCFLETDSTFCTKM